MMGKKHVKSASLAYLSISLSLHGICVWMESLVEIVTVN